MKKILLFLFAFCVLSVAPAWAISPVGTLYVRTDGGTPNGASGKTCNGLTDAAWNLGNSPNCAFNHPNWAIPPNGQPTTWQVAPGSMVVIHGPDDGAGTGSYQIGCKPGSADCMDPTINMVNTGNCAPGWTYDCGNTRVPNGISNTQRTTLRGCSSSGCGSKRYPEFWITGRMNTLYDIEGSQNITFSNIEITDHSSEGYYNECAVGVNSLCGRQAFQGANWKNITQEYMYIHGLTYQAMKIGGTGTSKQDNNWRMDHVRIEFNSYAGIDTDTCGNAGTCGFNGNIVWREVTINWNGCAEPYPIVSADTPVSGGCRDQNTGGGYGDGYGGSDSGGNWDIDGLECKHNVSDCLDLLYCGRQWHVAYGACTVRVNRMTCEGHPGNCFKGPTDSVITNSKLNGNCSWWSTHSSYYPSGFAGCREGGRAASPISIATNIDEGSTSTASPQIYNNTILSNADVIINYGGACPAPRSVIFRNNIVIGGLDSGSGNPGELTDLFYVSGRPISNDGCAQGNITFVESNNICLASTLKLGTTYCNNATDKNLDPQFVGTLMQGVAPFPGIYSGASYNDLLNLKSTSPAIGMANTSVPFVNGLDFNNLDRGSLWDAGAVESNVSAPNPPSANGATCTIGSQCNSGICCTNICTAAACATPPTTSLENASWNGSLGR